MGMGLEISGSNVANMPSRGAGPKMQVGERLSMCGQFVINGRGDWRPVPAEQQVPTQCAFDAAVPDAVMNGKKR